MSAPRAGAAARIAFLAYWAALAALLVAAGAAPGVPYNVRELFAGPRGWMAALALPLVITLWVGAPVTAMLRSGRGSRRRALFLPAVAVACGLLAFALLRATVSVESIWDIVGTPVLHWPGDWEIGGRFVALFAVIWTLIAGGAAAASALDPDEGPAAFVAWLAPALLTLVAGYLVVVAWAATDNLTELIRGGGSVVGAAVIAVWFLAVAVAASLFSRTLAGRGSARGWAIAGLATALAYPAGYLLLMLGTEARIEKYGSTFSALQFLLSPDREHYASGPALIVLYGVAHTLAWGGIALAQLPHWIAARRKTPAA